LLRGIDLFESLLKIKNIGGAPLGFQIADDIFGQLVNANSNIGIKKSNEGPRS
jgi:hypothetical protein